MVVVDKEEQEEQEQQEEEEEEQERGVSCRRCWQAARSSSVVATALPPRGGQAGRGGNVSLSVWVCVGGGARLELEGLQSWWRWGARTA